MAGVLRMVSAERLIRESIGAEGAISFAHFMGLALYAPGAGYYRAAHPVGAAGDYFTSPTAHPLFGTLLAAQLAQMWDVLGRPVCFTLLEAGAGGGVLARDIVAAAWADFPAFAAALRYVALDYAAPPADPAAASAPTVSPAAPAPGVAWVQAAGVPARGVVGCVLSNELLDALPVHRFVIEDGRPREILVTLSDGAFAEVTGAPSTSEAGRMLEELPSGLPEGYRGEVRPVAAAWVRDAADALERGFVLTIDYGDTAAGLYAAHRARGTVQSHYRHVATGNPYTRVGAQDITAHVDFTQVQETGAAAGLATLGYTTQGAFLRNLGADLYLRALVSRAAAAHDFAAGALPRQELLANRMAMQALVAPEGLGGFRVLAQGKGVDGASLWGFAEDNARRGALQAQGPGLRVPPRTAAHMPLYEGRFG